jgi:hypothetical protein
LKDSTNHIVFNYRAIIQENFIFESYNKSILDNLESIKKFEEKEMVFAEDEIGIDFFWIK